MEKKNIKTPKKLMKLITGVFILTISLFILYEAIPHIKMFNNTKIVPSQIASSIGGTTTLVNPEIAKSAPIMVNLYKDIETITKEDIVFVPAITGEWKESEEKNTLMFQPKNELNPGTTYSISLPLEDGELKQYFAIVEDPKILNIFPEGETNEESEITIVFNRPMVPLTTIDKVRKNSLPISIKPDTDGQWKWISTRTLQFQPKEQLQKSSTYTIETKKDFKTLDGVSLKPTTHQFTTRNLRLTSISNEEIAYNQPILIEFNQPINLKETAKLISLKNTTTEQDVKFHTEYYLDNEGKIDKSKIAIYQNIDNHNRKNFWDFNNKYEVLIAGAVPKEGDILFNEWRNGNVSISNIIKNIHAKSERSNYATLDFFDPEGSLDIEFFEDINIEKSIFRSKYLDTVKYVEECDPNQELDEDEECEKITNKAKIKITFNKDSIKQNEDFTISLEEIINSNGVKINPNPLEYTLTSPPKFELTELIPGDDSESLTKLNICSTTPIKVPTFHNNDNNDDVVLEKIENYLTLDNEFKFYNWDYSTRVTEDNLSYYSCGIDEFETTINYGLNPHTTYNAKLNANSVYNEKSNIELQFKTKNVDPYTLNFYSLQDNYTVTTPEKTKMTFAVENMDYINMNICQLDKRTMLETLNNGIEYTSQINPELCTWTTNTNIKLPKKYWAQNYFQIDLKDYIPYNLGHYVVSFSHPDYTGWSDSQVYEHSFVSITNLSVVEKNIEIYEGNNTKERDLSQSQKDNLNDLYWVTDIKTLNPVIDADITTYSFAQDNRTLELGDQLKTDSKGIVKSPVMANRAGAIVSKKNDSAIIGDYESDLSFASYAYNNERIYIYTDRPIYKPGDTVHIKGIYRIGYDGKQKIVEDKNVHLDVKSSGRASIYSTDLNLNSFGTFDTEFVLDSSASLGSYTIRIGSNDARFDVEEYTQAAFKLDLETNKSEYIQGDKLKLDIQADYYFGLPLESGEVTYSIVSQDYNFDRFTDEYFKFGSNWYYCFYNCNSNNEFIMHGEVELDSNGHAVIEKDLNFDELFEKEDEDENDNDDSDLDKNRSRIFIVNLSVTNDDGQQINSKKSFIVHSGEVYLGAQTDRYFFETNKEFNLKIKSVNTEGMPIKQGEITGEINKVTWEYNKRKEVDGGYYYKSEKETELVKEFTASTNNDGDWINSFILNSAGEYEIIIHTTDTLGNIVTTKKTIYVLSSDNMGGSGNLVRPTNDTHLEIVNENPELNVGDTASFLIKNPFTTKTKALVSIERGEIFDYEIIEIEDSFYNYEFKVTEEFIPNIYASVVLLSDDPELKYGETNFKVNIDNKNLKIQISPNKKTYLPGEEMKIDFLVTDLSNKPVESELSIAIVDMSVLALKGNPHKNPILYFYNNLPLTVETSANLKNILHEIDIKNGKGGGGGELETKKRGQFEDTAYWKAKVNTDQNGKASVSLKLPDNLTTWQIEAVGITKDTKLGAGYKEFLAKKPISISPLKPRFIIPGDKFKLGAKIFNQSEEPQKFDVTIESETLTINDNNSKTVKVKAGESKTVYFDVTAPLDIQFGKHQFTLSTKNENFEDTILQSLKITRNQTYETVATANYTSNEIANEFIFLPKNINLDEGSLTINTSATLAVFLSDALNSLMSYTYGCTEQISSKLNAIAIIKNGLNLKNIGDKFEIEDIIFDGKSYSIDQVVTLGIARINENQNEDGGFGYYKGWDSNFYLTASVLQSLGNLTEISEDINSNRIDNAANFIISYINNAKKKNNNDIITAAYALNSSTYTKPKLNELTPLIKESILNDSTIENLDNSSLALLAIIMAENKSIFNNKNKEKIFNALENKIHIDARGAYLEGGQQWYNYDTSIKSTALLLQALISDDNDNAMLGNILKWLMNNRAKDGAWGSTSNTISVIDAFTNYMIWQKENESDYTLDILLSSENIKSYTFNADTILNQESVEIAPLDQLEINKLLPLQFKKIHNNDLNNNLYYDIALKYFLPIQEITARDEGFTISRNFYQVNNDKMVNINQASVGDIIHGQLKMIVPETSHFVAIEDYIPAGMELINFNLSTENEDLVTGSTSSPNEKYEPMFKPDKEELHNDRLFLFKENLNAGTYTYDYYTRVLIPGEFNHLPAVISEMYFPENFGRTNGDVFIIK